MVAGSVTTVPDFYGPFLSVEQIHYRPDPEADRLVLVRLGDFTLQVAGMESAMIPNNHARFILSALLFTPDGKLPYGVIKSEFYAGKSKASASSVLSTTVKNLTGMLDEDGVPIVEKLKQGVNVSLRLSPKLEIIRLANDEPTNVAINETPVRQEDFDDALALAVALGEHISGEGPPIIYGTSPRAIEQARKALRLAHSDYEKDSEPEARFREQSRILASLSNGVQPIPGVTSAQGTGYSREFLNEMFDRTTMDGDELP